uniref:Myo-5 n=1 Tax=Pristionchus pacificus TaxID=54126 RepID=A0A2A6CAB1_PRIPA|eukprot:PDM75142.1 myo-5 [Pristionchus pacificus]
MMEQDPGWQFLRQSQEQALAAQTKKFDSKKNVWIADAEEGFIAAEIKSAKGDVLTVVTTKGEKSLKKDDTQQMNPPKFEKTEDMANLTFLNDASVLHNLRQRYFSMMIYTYSGLFCVVINPYKRLPIYSESICKMYQGRRRNEVPPHLFAVADEAYRNMVNDKENQSMLITGESGAGKTENTKKVISYFAMVGASQSKKAASKSDASLEDQIVQTNPVLEAYGNAKTVRNNNSSRFGKFIRIHFNHAGKLAGADIEHYLLEKSRVIKQAPGERCYHIFYQLYSGAVAGLKEKLFLTRPLKEYHFVAQAELSIDGVDDKEEMLLTDEAFDIMKFTAKEKSELFAVTAAIMHMGEMKFKQRPREEQAEVEDIQEGNLACQLFNCDQEKFVSALLKPRVKVGTEWVNKGQNLEQVNWAVGALAKGLYARMFQWLIKRCNKTLDAQDLSRDCFIGVLDIAGFEIFDLNSFEQLWINFVNERLQQFFNHHMFVLEQEEYKREGIQWEFIDFGLDLQACIELIEKPLGIISMLDEECIVPKASDATLAQKLNDQHQGKHPNFQKPKPPKGKQAPAHFALVHYAGTVQYNVTAWLEKNKDPLNDTAVTVLKANNGNQLVSDLWADYQTQEDVAAATARGAAKATGKKKGKSASFMTVSMMYRESLNKLMTMLHQTHPHFIRCIIPNEQKKSGLIEANLVLNQLTCNGVLEGIRICRKGFPNRLPYLEFKQRYALLAADEAKAAKDESEAGKKICGVLANKSQLKPEEYQCGVTKVFFKAGVLAHLEELRDVALTEFVTKFQCAVRHYLAQSEYKMRMNSRVGILVVQRNVRAWCTLRTWPWFKLLGQELEEAHAKEERARKELEAELARVSAEKSALALQLEAERDTSAEGEERSAKLLALKSDLEKQNEDLSEQIADMEDKNSTLQKQKKKAESDNETLKKNVGELESTIKKQESEKQSKDHQIRSLQDEIAAQDEVIAKVSKEKKQQEEANRKLLEDIQAEEDKVNHLNKIKSKLEQTLDELEDNLERERRSKQDVEKQRRKIEGELKVAQETIEELNKLRHDGEQIIKRKDMEIASITSKLEDEQSLVAKLQKQIKELLARIAELEEELEAERASRAKAEKARADMQMELEELGDRLDEAGGATQAQMELNKKREAELSKLRRDLEEAAISHESAIGALRKKHNDAIAELSDQLDTIQKHRAKLEKEKSGLQREIDELQAGGDADSKHRQNAERLAKQLEAQLTELQLRSDELQRNNQELMLARSKTQQENTELNRSIPFQAQNYQLECQQLRDQMDDEAESKTELARLLSKANAETAQWRARFEGEGMVRAEEIEEARRRLAVKLQEMQEQCDQANQKVASVEKAKQRVAQELEDAQAHSLAASLEKKQKGFDRVVDEWRGKCEGLVHELESAQRDTRAASTETARVKNHLEEAHDQMEQLRRENKAFAQELKDLTDQLGDGGKNVHELQKARRRLECELQEAQQALEEAEVALEAEESKVMRAQIEISQVRSEIDKRLAEKEEEFENTRKNHARAFESLQATLESETRQRTELLRMKKKLETDINELEVALDHSNKQNVDAQRAVKKHLETIRDLQVSVEEEQRARDDAREQLMIIERRAQTLQTEKEELVMNYDQSERSRRQAETENIDLRETTNALNEQNISLTGLRRKHDGEIAQLHADLEEALSEQRSAEDRARKSQSEAAKLTDDLKLATDEKANNAKAVKAADAQIKSLQLRLEEAEANGGKGTKRQMAKLENSVHELEQEIDSEQRRHTETQKYLRNKDRRVRELTFQVDEDKKSQERMYDLMEKLNGKIKTYKRQLEEAEELATNNLTKYRQLQHQLEEAQERADTAENALHKARTQQRSGSGFFGRSASSTTINFARSSSRSFMRNLNTDTIEE